MACGSRCWVWRGAGRLDIVLLDALATKLQLLRTLHRNAYKPAEGEAAVVTSAKPGLTCIWDVSHEDHGSTRMVEGRLISTRRFEVKACR